LTARQVSGDVLVLVFGDRRVPRTLADLTAVKMAGCEGIEIPAGTARVIVIGDHTDLSATLGLLLREDRLDVEVGFVTSRLGSARRARHGAAQRVPLIRDETAAVVVRSARWLPTDTGTITGEAIVDDTVLFDGVSSGVEIEPIDAAPGLRARPIGGGPRSWVAGRAAQLGSTGVLVERDGVAAARPVRRSAFYRNVQGWLRVG
jgi:hypothetical protein